MPDIYDAVKYDAIHNAHLGLDLEDLYTTAKALADTVIPNEYGLTAGARLHIGKSICSQLLGKILADMHNMKEESLATAGISDQVRRALCMCNVLCVSSVRKQCTVRMSVSSMCVRMSVAQCCHSMLYLVAAHMCWFGVVHSPPMLHLRIPTSMPLPTARASPMLPTGPCGKRATWTARAARSTAPTPTQAVSMAQVGNLLFVVIVVAAAITA